MLSHTENKQPSVRNKVSSQLQQPEVYNKTSITPRQRPKPSAPFNLLSSNIRSSPVKVPITNTPSLPNFPTSDITSNCFHNPLVNSSFPDHTNIIKEKPVEPNSIQQSHDQLKVTSAYSTNEPPITVKSKHNI